MRDLKSYKNLVYRIIGAAMQVHNELGFGLLEAVYEEALSIELSGLDIKHETQKELDIFYKGILLNKKYRMDIVVEDIICELKVVTEICAEHRMQLCNYLKLTQKPIGLLINFGRNKLEGERWAYDKDSRQCYLLDFNMQKIK